MKAKSFLLAAATAIAITVAAVTGCSSSLGQGTGPFTFPCSPADCYGSYTRGPVVLNHIYDVEILYLHNYSGHSARLLAVHLIRPAEGIRVVNIRAYLLSQAKGGGSIDEGDLAKGCPEFYKPHLVTDVLVPKHSDSRWVVVIALIFKRPGRYRFGTARIDYVTAGQQGWQYFGLPDLRFYTLPIKSNPGLYRPMRCRPGQIIP